MIALSTDSLQGYGLNRIFKFTKDAEFNGIDLVIDPKNYDSQNADYIKELSNKYKIPVISIQTPPNSNPKKVEKAIEIAKKLNCKIIVIQPPKLFEFKYISWLKKEIPKIRQKENISIALENAPSSTFLGIIPDHAMNNLSALRDFKHVCLDTSRIAQKEQDIIRIYRALHKYVVHIHLSNVKGSKLYCLPEKGILPLESLLSKMKQEDYPGAFSIKVNPKELKAGDDEKVIQTLKNTKKFYEKFFVLKDIKETKYDEEKNSEEESESSSIQPQDSFE